MEPIPREKRSRRKRLLVIVVVALVLFGAVPLWLHHAQDVADQRARAASAEVRSELEGVSLDQLWQAEVTSEVTSDPQAVFHALPRPSRARQTGSVTITKDSASFSYEASYGGSTSCVNVHMTADATLVVPGRCPR